LDFREKLEAALAKPIGSLRAELSGIPTLSILNYYQYRIHLVKTDKSNVPDGFIFKWRYLWAQALVNPLTETPLRGDPDFTSIDRLVEEIYEVYGTGALFDPGKNRGSEKEFLARLGLAVKVREPDVLAFPDQLKWWSTVRLEPFDDSYFLPTFGVRFAQIVGWFDQLISTLQERLNTNVNELAAIYGEIKKIQVEIANSTLSIDDVQKKAVDLRIGERLETNGRMGEALHIFRKPQVFDSLPEQTIDLLTTLFGIKPGEVDSDVFYPHDDNPLEFKTFVLLPDSRIYFLDPSNTYRIVAKTFQREILSQDRLKDRYLKNRDRATEQLVADRMKRIFPGSEVRSNYYLKKGSNEKDLLVRHANTVILIESKNARVRPFIGKHTDLLNFQRDFQHSVQYSFDQANAVKQAILNSEETTFFDDKARPYFSIARDDVQRLFIVCVTVTPRGPFGTDLSYELKKEPHDSYPLALNLLDFDTICKYLDTPEKFIGYLDAREKLHGKAWTGDELNFAGYFFKFGHLNVEEKTFLTDDFSAVFDRDWFRGKGIDIEEPLNPPANVRLRRRGNQIEARYDSGRVETVEIDPDTMRHISGKPIREMKGSERNQPCPCGSGVKFKRCCGINSSK
jgi:hypothetical protein